MTAVVTSDIDYKKQKGDRGVTHVSGHSQSATTSSSKLHPIRELRRVGNRATRENENQYNYFTQTAREIASLDDMVEKNLINIARSHRTELCVVGESRVDGSKDRDTLGVIEKLRQVGVHGSSGRDESREVVYTRDCRRGIPGYSQDVGDDLERL